MGKEHATTTGMLNRMAVFSGLDSTAFGPQNEMPSFSRHLLGTDGKTALPAVSLALEDGEDIERAVARLFNIVNTSDPAGIIKAWPLVAAPPGHLLCDGTAYLRADYSRLFASIGTQFDTFRGASAPSGAHFRVPNYSGMTLMMAGTPQTGAGTDAIALLGIGGKQKHALSEAELASHSHAVYLWNKAGGYATPGGTGLTGADTTLDVVTSVAGPDVTFGTTNVGSSLFSGAQVATYAGSNTAHENLPPYSAINYIIRI